MRLLTLLAAGLLAGPLLAADDPKDDMKTKDADAILGVWKVDKLDAGTADAPPADTFAKVRFVFQTGGKLTVTGPDGKDKELTFQLDPADAVKGIDIRGGDKTTLGVYALRGDTLTLCSPVGPPPDGKGSRPTELKADGKAGLLVMTLKRVKDEKKDK